MKWKIKSAMNKQSISRLEMGKYDYTIWTGNSLEDCCEEASLFRDVITDRKHSNTQYVNGTFGRNEQLTFQSRKAAYRFIKKHYEEIVTAYGQRHCGRRPKVIVAMTWRNGRRKEIVYKVRYLYMPYNDPMGRRYNLMIRQNIH